MRYLMICIFLLILMESLIAIDGSGVMAGINLANMYSDKLPDYDRKIGLDFGYFMKWGSEELTNFQSEFHYTQKGSTHRYKINNINHKELIIRDYLEVPFLVKFPLPFQVLSEVPNDQYVPCLYLGPEFSYRIHSKHTVWIDDTSNIDTDENTGRLTLGMVMGAGINIDRVTLEGRVNFNFLPITEKGISYYHGETQVFVGYKF
jgi:hypothetical protein